MEGIGSSVADRLVDGDIYQSPRLLPGRTHNTGPVQLKVYRVGNTDEEVVVKTYKLEDDEVILPTFCREIGAFQVV